MAGGPTSNHVHAGTGDQNNTYKEAAKRPRKKNMSQGSIQTVRKSEGREAAAQQSYKEVAASECRRVAGGGKV